MNKTASIVTLAVLGLASFAFVGPAAATDTGVCTDQPEVVAPAGGGFSGFWLNDCIVSSATSMVVTLTNADAIGHRFLFGKCIGTGGANVALGAARDYTVSVLASGAVKVDGAFCSPADLQDRSGGVGSSGPDTGPVVVQNADGSTTIHYICGVHRAAMHGSITLGA